MERTAEGDDKKKAGIARMIAGCCWDTVSESLSDSELAEELKVKIWANQKLGTYEIALLEQAIERLNQRKEP